ncbi:MULTISPECIES: amino acid ABC transporter substrate-binding protein [Hungatella]|uniref:Transporter substrate-binding domain-containing protein n=1 Tax=Hungatella hathewayi TaxID=154046 RepID=A0AAW9WJT7_9FIRM|nr:MULTISPECIES: amino acid ABC transporter substrate-binding protein [Hungatella]MCQ4830195.1 amino acid ABC transporter substrate-binding protein [Hungatella sp. SL.1.14]MUB65242.1 transporter substrate-binding domain-containing protein [Hungatella hathewayi]CUQ37474.1 family 3 extracellular solute-binding protein [Hungatella hathewayi]
MKKRAILMAAALGMMAVVSGCSGQAAGNTAAETAGTMAKEAETTAAEAAADTDADTKAPETEASEAGAAGGTFTVGFDQEFPPMGYVGDDGEYTGFDLEVAEEVAKRLGMEFVPQPVDWAAKDMELESGNIDCIWNGFTMTGREDDYTWTEAYMANQQVFVVTAESGIKTLADLAGKVVEVQAESSAEAALKDDPDLTGTFGTLQTTPDYNTAFMDLQMGAVDAIAMDEVVARFQIEQRQVDFIVLDETLAAENYAVGFKKGNDALKDQVQAQLEALAADGTLAKISEKWFDKDITTIGK